MTSAPVLRRLADRQGISLNKAALKMLRKGIGLSVGMKNPNAIGNSLDDLFGTWSQDEADSIDAALEVLETVAESMWK